MSELCRMYGISRPTGYAVLARYRACGEAGLEARSHAAARHPNQTPAKVEELVLSLRRAHPLWGPRPLKKILEDRHPQLAIPAASTIGAIVEREGLTHHRRKRRRVEPYQQPFASVQSPNDEWACDFKGWMRTTDGERIDPLTISDSLSRYLLRCQAVPKTDTARVQAFSRQRFGSSGCRLRFAPTTGRRLPPARLRACHGFRCGGSSWVLCRNASRPATRNRTDATNACTVR
jgi:transposase